MNSFTHLAGLWSDPRRRACWATRATIAILALGVAGWSLVKDFDKDEIEAVHSAWKMLHGERIYVDFFQHHHPLLYAYLTPVIALCGERPATLLACRVAMWPFLAGMLAATYILGRRVFGRPAATIGVLLALASWPLMVKAVEIRPDVPQVLCGMIALVLLFPRTRQAARRSALRTGAEACVADHVYMVPGSAKERDFRGAKGDNPSVFDSPVLRHFLIGVCLGVAFLFLQKALFLIAGIGLVVAWRVFARETGWAVLLALPAGIAVVVVLFALWLAANGPLREYVFLNWTLNAHYRYQFGFDLTLRHVCKRESITVLFAAIACLGYLRNRRRWELAFLTLCLVGSIATVPAPYLQYWMPALPLVALLAGHGMLKLLRRRRRLLFILLVCSAVMPAVVEAACQSGINFSHLKRIGYVLDVTAPGDAVYDGDAQFNVFRRDIDYFWFSLSEHGALRSYQDLRPYEYDVYERIARMKPKVISSHEIDNLADPRIQEHYTPSEQYDGLLVRNR